MIDKERKIVLDEDARESEGTREKGLMMNLTYTKGVCTHSGVLFDFSNIQPDDISLDDLAHHLSLVNRFAGASEVPVSVCEHSLYCVELLYKHCENEIESDKLDKRRKRDLLNDDAKWPCSNVVVGILDDIESEIEGEKGRNRLAALVLLHDAHEYITGDLVTQFKSLLPEVKRIQENIDQAIYKHFGIDPPSDEEKKLIKQIDGQALIGEARAFLPIVGYNALKELGIPAPSLVPMKYGLEESRLEYKKRLLDCLESL